MLDITADCGTSKATDRVATLSLRHAALGGGFTSLRDVSLHREKRPLRGLGEAEHDPAGLG